MRQHKYLEEQLRAREQGAEHFVKIPDDVMRHLPGLSGTALKVYVAIRSHENHKPLTGGRCWPTEERIAEMIGSSPRTVRRAIAELKALNNAVLTVENSRFPDGKFGKNFYEFPDRRERIP